MSMDFTDQRLSYEKGELDQQSVPTSPFELFKAWMNEALAQKVQEPYAMSLATCGADKKPSVRIVLLREITETGIVFYTNYESSKAQELDSAGHAAFVLHWKSLARQVRVRGTVTREDGQIADAYYQSRSLQSRLGAWASRQSQPLKSRSALMADVARVTAQKGTNPARPPFWGGYRITPLEIEFWADGEFRLHDRFQWRKQNPGAPWSISRLNP